LAAATPEAFGNPNVVDETLEEFCLDEIKPGDIVGIGIHTANALRGYEVGRLAREKGAWVVFGGIHASLYPEEALELGHAHSVVKGDGDLVWPMVLEEIAAGKGEEIYEGGQVESDSFLEARWDLLPKNKYMWASVQTVRGCPKKCTFCSVWRTDGRKPRERLVDAIVREVVTLRKMRFRFIALADDNFYPVSLEDIERARERNSDQLDELLRAREERFELMRRLAEIPDVYFFTQITMEVADDPEFLDAMFKAKIKGALVGVESVTPEGLKAVHKDFNASGEQLVQKLRKFREHGVYVLGSFIFGLPTDNPETFSATTDLASRAQLAFAQFVTLTPYPGTVDFLAWERKEKDTVAKVGGVPLTRYWLIPGNSRPKLYIPHPVMDGGEIRRRTQEVWDRFYSLKLVWRRSDCTPTLRSRLAFIFVSKLYRQMYANTGMATDSARQSRASNWARWIAKPCLRLFRGAPMPDLECPVPSDMS
jgi:radical SAM superfamily enzyme YgiQ (UPF0313 family)